MSKEITPMKNCTPAFACKMRPKSKAAAGGFSGSEWRSHRCSRRKAWCFHTNVLFLLILTYRELNFDERPHKRSIKYSSSHLFFRGKPWLAKEDSSWECLEWVLDFICWPMVRGWDKAAFRKARAESGRDCGTRCCLGPVTYAQPDSCTGWWKWGYWSGCREAAWMNLCPSGNLFR